MSGTASAPRGLDGIIAVQTRLSHVDGQNGLLVIGGYELKELAVKVTFEEAAHLLWTGHLPSASEADALSREIAALRSIPESTMTVVCEAAKRRAPPIDTLRMACSTLSLDIGNPSDISQANDVPIAKLLVARFPTIVAAHARVVAGQQPIAPRTDRQEPSAASRDLRGHASAVPDARNGSGVRGARAHDLGRARRRLGRADALLPQ